MASSHVATALNTPIPMNSRPASSQMNRSLRSQRRDTATDGFPGNAAGARATASTHPAATTATAAWTHSRSVSPPACSSGPPVRAAARMPANKATLPIEIAVIRSLAGKYRPATLVIELSTNGWPAAITNWPATAQPYDDGPASRSSAPAPVSTAPRPSARLNRASSQRPAGSARITYMSGKITARSPTAPSDTPMIR